MYKIKSLIAAALVFIACSCSAQHFFLPLSNETMLPYEPYLHSVASSAHTSVKPWLSKDLFANTPYDSLNTHPLKEKKFNKTWAGRKLFSEHLFDIKDDDVRIIIDPAIELSFGNDFGPDSTYAFLMNTRGLYMQGTIGERFSFNASFYENLGHFPYYLDSVIKERRVVPGQGRIKTRITRRNFDYAFATGTISYQLKKHFTFQFGHDRNFIGDGYRTLLLSDNTYPYPFLKIITDVWKVRYMNIFAVMQDLEDIKLNDDKAFVRKYGSFHYLDINIGRHVTAGLFEAVIWKSDSVTGHRGFDINYLNPFVFLRPIEFGIGSPDNVLLGINLKVKLNSSNHLYGQVMLDEFLLDEVKAGKGWWGNKQGLMAGFKSYNVFGLKDLHLQGEFSYVRPFTYQHREPLGNYGHYRQPLAHPLGANFSEATGLAFYSFKRFNIRGQLSYALTGFDTDSTNYGQDIFKSYENRTTEYGNEVGQGIRTKIATADLNVSFTVNPSYNLRLFASVLMRRETNDVRTVNTLAIQAGVKTYLFNRYYDF